MCRTLRLVLSALVALIVLVVLVITRPRVREYEGRITGFWVGDPAFLEQAGLSDVLMYLAPREGCSRQGYLVMVGTNGGFLMNQSLEVTYGASMCRWWSATSSHFRPAAQRYSVPRARFDFGGADSVARSYAPWGDGAIAITYDPLAESLTLHDGEKIYAFLWKDPHVTASTAAAAAAAKETSIPQ